MKDMNEIIKENKLDLSKWNTNNVTDMSFLFNGCKSLSSLPDISKWNKIMSLIWDFYFLGVYLYHLYLIFQK